MLAALRALECEKSYWECELSFLLVQCADPNNYCDKLRRQISDAQSCLLRLQDKFEEI